MRAFLFLRLTLTIVMPAQAGIQYAAAFVMNL